VLAISGQESVEKKSAMVKGMAAFVDAHARQEVVVLSKGTARACRSRTKRFDRRDNGVPAKRRRPPTNRRDRPPIQLSTSSARLWRRSWITTRNSSALLCGKHH
jgi:hypothetical protein